ncbi:MAG: hypothetical protein P4L99_14455 [Chthoniobacter sp.]|nr:hypothetical protein [Chthoniobacter sp.]
MKHLLLTAFLLCSAIFPARADIVIPKPTQLTVSNLSAYPKLKFTIAIGDNAAAQPLEEKKTYELNSSARLFVQDADTKPRVWATVEHHDPRGGVVKIAIKKVAHGNAGVEVIFDREETGPPSRYPRPGPPHTAEAWPPFILAGVGCCGLVLLARRRDPRDEAP